MLLAWIGLKPRWNMVQLNKTVTSCATVCRCHTVVGADEQELDGGCQQKRFSFFFFFFYRSNTSLLRAKPTLAPLSLWPENKTWIIDAIPHTASEGLPSKPSPGQLIEKWWMRMDKKKCWWMISRDATWGYIFLCVWAEMTNNSLCVPAAGRKGKLNVASHPAQVWRAFQWLPKWLCVFLNQLTQRV